jgi:pullulanase
LLSGIGGPETLPKGFAGPVLSFAGNQTFQSSHIAMTDILKRRQTHFVLWCPRETSPPVLILGRLRMGNPARFKELARLPLQPVTDRPGLWELEAASCGLIQGQVYHYWFEVDNSWPEPARIQVTDPLAYGVDYRLYAPQNPSVLHPAAVIGWFEDRLVSCDPHGEKRAARVVPFEKLPRNSQLVIYELPTAWVRTAGSDEFERGVGTFRDVRALVKKKVPGGNFPVVRVASSGKPYLAALGVNALQLLPPADSIYAREWAMAPPITWPLIMSWATPKATCRLPPTRTWPT